MDDRLNLLNTTHYIRPQDGEVLVFRQTHANGSDEVMAEMRLHGEALDDAIYLLTKARARRDAARKLTPKHTE